MTTGPCHPTVPPEGPSCSLRRNARGNWCRRSIWARPTASAAAPPSGTNAAKSGRSGSRSRLRLAADPRQPQCGVDFEVDGGTLRLLGGEPLAEPGDRYVMDDDLLAGDAAAVMLAGQAGGVEQMGELRGHARRGGSRQQRPHFRRTVAGFLQQLAPGGGSQRFAPVLLLVAHQSGRNLDDPALDRNPELFDQDHLIGGSDGQDADAGIRLRAAHKIPAADPVQAKPTGFKQGLYRSHDFQKVK